MGSESDIQNARRYLEIEAEAILQQRERLGPEFASTVEMIAALRGKVVVSGIGKSGIIGMKMAATLASTGTPAFFLHPVEGVHGDMGVISQDDLLVAISSSGETEELVNLVVAVQRMGVPALSICGSRESTLASLCDHLLVVSVDREACPLGLAPTASTAAVLAMGDALALTLSARSEFTAEDYAAFHPGGTLGRRLKLCVRDIMYTGSDVPVLPDGANFGEALRVMTDTKNLGVALVTDSEGKLIGVLTDGDLRRILLRSVPAVADFSISVSDVMTRNPKVVEAEALASEALRIMEAHSITSLAIVDAASRPVGIVHLHDILGRGKVIF